MGLWDFFGPESGRKRRAWLDELDKAVTDQVRYLVGPDVMGAVDRVGGLLEFTDAADIRDSVVTSQRLWNNPSWENAKAYGTAAGAVAVPLVSARLMREGVDFAGDAWRSLTDDIRRFVGDEHGGLNYTRRADEYAGMHSAPGRNADNAPASDLTKIFPDDVYGPRAVQYYGHGEGGWENETINALRKVRGNPDAEITVYRAVPEGVEDINAGDWVTPNRRYAEMHGDSWVEDGNYRIIEEKVRAGDLYTDANSIHEFGWDPAPRRTPAEQQAQGILDLLASGRASEVTDDMMDLGDPVQNARLNEYLFNNYDLPMDEASRMARAEEMGFMDNYETYHGTGDDFHAFRESFRSDPGSDESYKVGIYSAYRPKIAETYAPNIHGGQIIPLATRRTFDDVEVDALGRNWNDIEMDSPAYRTGDADDLTVHHYFPNADDGEGLTRTNAIAREAMRDGAGSLRINNTYDIGGFRDLLKSLDDYGPHDVRTDFYPHNIRSRFARFDPRLAHLRNLSAGIGAGLLGFGAITEQDKSELEAYLGL